jgi:hypothetical protein
MLSNTDIKDLRKALLQCAIRARTEVQRGDPSYRATGTPTWSQGFAIGRKMAYLSAARWLRLRSRQRNQSNQENAIRRIRPIRPLQPAIK